MGNLLFTAKYQNIVQTINSNTNEKIILNSSKLLLLNAEKLYELET